jgi:hypothetical protein
LENVWNAGIHTGKKIDASQQDTETRKLLQNVRIETLLEFFGAFIHLLFIFLFICSTGV